MEAFNLENLLSDTMVEDRLSRLKYYSAFRFFPHLLTTLERQKELQILPAETVIVDEGEDADFIFMSLDNDFERSLQMGHLNEKIFISNVEPFEFIGFSEVLERKKFVISYQTQEPTTILKLTRIDLLSVFSDAKDLNRFRLLNSSESIRHFVFNLIDLQVPHENINAILDGMEVKPRILKNREIVETDQPGLFLLQSGIVAGAQQNQTVFRNIIFKRGNYFSGAYLKQNNFKDFPVRAMETVYYHHVSRAQLEKNLSAEVVQSLLEEPMITFENAPAVDEGVKGISEITVRHLPVKKLSLFGFTGDSHALRFGEYPLSPYQSTLWNFLILNNEEPNESYVSKRSQASDVINLSQFASSLEDAGFSTNLRRYHQSGPESIPEKSLIYFFGRPAIFLSYQWNKIFLMDPVYGLISVTSADFFASWNRNLVEVKRSAVLFVLPADGKIGPDKFETVGKNILNYFLDLSQNEFKNLRTFQLFQSLVVIAIPTFLYGLVNQSVGKAQPQFIYGYYWGLGLFILFQGAATYSLNIYSGGILAQMKMNAQTYFYKLFLNTMPSPQMPLRAGTVATRMSLLEFSLSALKYQRTELILSLGSVGLFLIIIGSFSWLAALVVGITCCISLGFVYFLRKKGGFTEVNTALLRQEAMDSFVDIVHGFRSIQATQTMKSAEQKMNSVMHQIAKGGGQYAAAMTGLTQKGLLIFKLGGILALFIVFKEMVNHRAVPAEIFGLTLYLSFLYSPFRGLLMYFTNYNTTGLFSLSGQLAATQTFKKSKNLMTLKLKGSVQFDRVSFRYSDRLPFSLSEISFKIRPGERIAIVGRSGSGKSTLAKLIARQVEATSGKVTYDEVDSRLIEPWSIQSQIGFVPQVPTLFAGSIASNICFSDEEALLQKTIKICRATRAHAFIKNLPGDYSYRIKEFGVGLSTGQKQILALTRVLFAEPELLVLDEATAHLDPEAETFIIDQVYERKQFRTTVMVVQKMTTARRADRIFVVKQGRIVEEGDHNRLLALGGEYAELYRHQVSDD